MNECTKLWLTITNVRLRANSEGVQVHVQVQGDAGEAADCGPTWLECRESIVAQPAVESPPANPQPHIKADKLYDKILEALQNNRNVRGKLECLKSGDAARLVIGEVDVKYQ